VENVEAGFFFSGWGGGSELGEGFEGTYRTWRGWILGDGLEARVGELEEVGFLNGE
jgi:hypothetical protein